MKFFTSTFVLFALFFTSTGAAFGQKMRVLTPPLGRVAIKVEAGVVIEPPEAFTDGNGVYIHWRTQTETNNLGFYVYRVSKGNKEVVDGKFIPGSAFRYRDRTVSGEEYTIFDTDGEGTTQYVVESYQRDGARTVTEPFFPRYVANLSSITGQPGESLFRNKIASTGRVRTDKVVYNPELQKEIDQHAQLADPVTQLWVASQPGAKIGVRKTGMYRVTRNELITAGFDVNSDHVNWQLYTDGVQQDIIVGPSGDYIQFYGRGIDTNESDTRMYYLLSGPAPGQRMTTVGLRPSFSTVRSTNYDESLVIKERFSYLVDVLNGDTENYFGHLIGNFPSFSTFDLTGIDTTSASVRLVITGFGYSATAHSANLTLNGHPLGQLTGAAGEGRVLTFEAIVPTSFLVDGVNTLDTIAPAGNDFIFFDTLRVDYKRRHVASQNRLSFSTLNSRKAILEGFSSPNVQLFDITYDGHPVQLTGAAARPNGPAFDLEVPAYRNRAMFAVEESGLLQAASLGANVPSTLTTVDHDATLVIITHRNFLTEANAWANYRRGEGIPTEVIDVDDIFDEYNYGVLKADSIRDFLSYARFNWLNPPQYVLLIGDGTYDPRNYEGTGFWDLIPAKLVDTVFSETASDDALVDFNNDGLAELAIGRIPARTPAQVTNALNKTMAFETLSATQNLSRGAVFNYDNPIGWNFQQMSLMMRDQVPVGPTYDVIARSDTNPNQALIAAMNNGRYLVNFAGHGTVTSWANASNFRNSHVSLLTNGNGLSVYTMLTCLNGFYHNVGFDSLAETLLNSTTGGAAASWASSGETTPDIQQIMGIHFYQQVAAGQITRLGDLIVDAKTVVNGGRDVRLSWVLIGDPLLKMR